MKTTDNLANILKKAKPDDLTEVLQKNEEKLATADKPFAGYLRHLLKEKGLKQQDVFLAADIPERYGYKLISEQKRTRQRDVILRLCFAAHLSLDEMQRALKLYELSPLYSRITRDAVLMVAVNNEVYEIQSVNDMLEKHEQEPLQPCGATDNV